jgi:hypothetical protein
MRFVFWILAAVSGLFALLFLALFGIVLVTKFMSLGLDDYVPLLALLEFGTAAVGLGLLSRELVPAAR